MFAGVSGGLGDYTGVDPAFFRIGFIVLTLAGGSGLLLYGLAWLLIPEEDETTPLGLTMFERIRGHRWVGFAFIALFSLILLNWVRLGTPDWNVLWAVSLVSIGFVLLRDEPKRESPPAAQRSTQGSVGAVPVAQPRVRRPRKPRSPLGFMTLGAAFVAVSIAAVLMGANAVELDPGQFVALGVMTIGLGLVVGAWWGRARFLVLIAMLLLPIMVVASMIDVPLKGSIGKNEYLQLRRDVDPEYQVMFGTLHLDFTRFRFGDEPTEVDILFGAGDVGIYVPPGVDVTVNGGVDLGFADVFGESYEGRDLIFGDDYERDGSFEGELIINVDGGLGSFDTTWARWAERDKRFRAKRREQRQEKRQKARREERAEVKKDGRGRNSN